MPDLPCRGGGGVNPASMAQNDTHVALIILTTQMWGGRGIIGGKNFFGPKFVFLRLRRQHPFLHKPKGPTRNPISPTPPPSSFGGRPCRPPPAEQFSGRPEGIVPWVLLAEACMPPPPRATAEGPSGAVKRLSSDSRELRLSSY